MILYFNIE